MLRSGFWLSSALISVITLGGCKTLLKKREAVESASAQASAPAPPPPAAQTPPPAPTAAVQAAAANDAEIPAPQDFEDEAFEKITTQNFETELARLEKEIGK
jgi:hypothetical protein